MPGSVGAAFFGLFSFELVLEFELLFSGCFAALVFSFAFVVVGVSPSLVDRLMSTATVCPTLTTSPAWGS